MPLRLRLLIVTGGGVLCGLGAAAICLCLTSAAIGHEQWIDSAFPLLTLLAAWGAVAAPLTPALAGFIWLTDGQRLALAHRRVCALSFASAVALVALLTVCVPRRFAPHMPEGEWRLRALRRAHELRNSVGAIDWGHLDCERLPRLTGSDRARLRDAVTIYRNVGCDEASYWQAACEIALNHPRRALRLLGWDTQLGYFTPRAPGRFQVTGAERRPASTADRLRRRLLVALAKRTPPRQMRSLLALDEQQQGIDHAYWVAKSFAARGRWREATWTMNLFIDRSEWSMHHAPTAADIAEFYEFQAECYEQWSRQPNAPARMLRASAARALMHAAPLLPEREGALRARAGAMLLSAGSPLSAVHQLRQAKGVMRKGLWTTTDESRLRRAEQELTARVPAASIPARLDLMERIAGVLDGGVWRTDYHDLLHLSSMERLMNRWTDLPDALTEEARYVIAGQRLQIAYRHVNAKMRTRPGWIAVVDAVQGLRDFVRTHPQSRFVAKAELELFYHLRAQRGFRARQVAEAIAQLLRRHANEPDTATLLLQFSSAASAHSNSAAVPRLRLDDDDLQVCADMLGQLERGRKGAYRLAAEALAEIDLSRPNRWLQPLVDINLFNPDGKDLSRAPGMAAERYLSIGDDRRASDCAARALRFPELYAEQIEASYVLTVCELNPANLASSLARMRDDDFEDVHSAREELTQEPLAYRVGAAMPADYLVRTSREWQRAGFGREHGRALALHKQRDRDYRGAARQLERVVARYGDVGGGESAFARLCALQRMAIPCSDNLRSRRRHGRLERWTRSILTTLAQATERAQFNLAMKPAASDHPMIVRAFNRIAWNVAMRLQYESPPNAVTARAELVRWRQMDPFANADSQWVGLDIERKLFVLQFHRDGWTEQ